MKTQIGGGDARSPTPSSHQVAFAATGAEAVERIKNVTVKTVNTSPRVGRPTRCRLGGAETRTGQARLPMPANYWCRPHSSRSRETEADSLSPGP